MAHIRRHPKSPDRWQVRYVDPYGKERSKNFARKVDAEKYLHTVEVQKIRGEWTDPAAGKTRFGEWAIQVDATRPNRRDSTRARDSSHLRNLILPTFGDAELGAVQPSEIRAWIADLQDQGYAPATIAKAYQILSRSFRVAVSDGLIVRTPCREIKLPKDDRDERRFLTATEAERLAEAIDPRYRALILTGTYTGLRFGELAALRTNDLDLLRRTLRVDEQLSRQGSWRMVAGPLKSKKAYRTIGIPAFLCEELALHLTEYPSESDLVFSHAQGGPLDYNRFRRRTGTRPSGPPSVRRALPTTFATPTWRCSSPRTSPPDTSPIGSDTRAPEPSSTCTDTSTRASTRLRWRVSTGFVPKLRRTPDGHQTVRTSCRWKPNPEIVNP